MRRSPLWGYTGPSILLFCMMLVFCMGKDSFAEEGFQKELKTPEPPVDVALSVDGKWIYVLTEGGNLLVYGPEGKLKDKIHLGKNIDRIEAGPVEDLLVLSSRKDSLIRILRVDLIQEIDISGSPYKGPSGAPVVIVVFSDYQCGYCLQLDSLLDKIQKTFPGQVKIVFKNFPLKSHPLAMKAALSALSAGRQGKFWEFHDLLFKSFNKLSDDQIAEIAGELGLDLALFEKGKIDSSVQNQIRKDLREGEKLGLNGVPAVYMNGKRQRDRSMEGLTREINRILHNAGEKEAR